MQTFPPSAEPQRNICQMRAYHLSGQLRLGRLPHGFTLVELLVSVFIIAVLATLILGGVKHMIESSQGAVCMGNLKRIYSGIRAYSMDDNDRLPEAYMTIKWPDIIRQYDVPDKAFECPSQQNKLHLAGREISKGKDWRWWNDVLWVGYGYNYRYLAPDFGMNWGVPNPRRDLRFATFPRATSVILLADSIRYFNYANKTGSGWYLIEPLAGTSAYTIDPRHHGLANILWIDGHISPSKWDHDAVGANRYKFLEARNWDPMLP